jgi:hypothetical protein
MEKKKIKLRSELTWFAIILGLLAGFSIMAAETPPKKKPRVVYPEKTKFDFDGAQIEGEIRNPGEFYFQHKPEEKFDSLVKRRKNFHREMLRDVIFSK